MSEISLHPKSTSSFSGPFAGAAAVVIPMFKSNRLLAESRHSPVEDVKELQTLINRAFEKTGNSKRIEVNGKFGVETREAIQSFQRAYSIGLDAGDGDTLKLVKVDAHTREKGLYPDGIVGPRTAAVLSLIVGEGLEKHVPRFSEFKSSITGGVWDIGQVRSSAQWVASDAPIPASVRKGLAALTDDEIAVYTNIARKHNVEPQWLFAVGILESGLQPNVKNHAGSSAVGVLQFTQKTIDNLNHNRDLVSQVGHLTRSKILQMSLIEQAPIVDAYLSGVLQGRPVNNATDLYLSVLWPRAMGRDDNYVLFSKHENSKAFRQNNSFETNGDGAVTVGEVSRKVNRALASLNHPAKNRTDVDG